MGCWSAILTAHYIMETNKADKHFPQVGDPWPKFSTADTSPTVSQSLFDQDPLLLVYGRKQ